MGLKRHLRLLAQGFKDVYAYHVFKRNMKEEENTPDSLFNSEELKHNYFWTIIYKIVDIPENYQTDGTDTQKMQYINSLTRSVNEYFDLIVQWGDYLIYKIYHFENADDPSEPIMSYQVEWHFTPVALTQKVFWIDLAVAMSLIGCAVFSIIKWVWPLLL